MATNAAIDERRRVARDLPSVDPIEDEARAADG
jgi:hypothetical protein